MVDIHTYKIKIKKYFNDIRRGRENQEEVDQRKSNLLHMCGGQHPSSSLWYTGHSILLPSKLQAAFLLTHVSVLSYYLIGNYLPQDLTKCLGVSTRMQRYRLRTEADNPTMQGVRRSCNLSRCCCLYPNEHPVAPIKTTVHDVWYRLVRKCL